LWYKRKSEEYVKVPSLKSKKNWKEYVNDIMFFSYEYNPQNLLYIK